MSKTVLRRKRSIALSKLLDLRSFWSSLKLHPLWVTLYLLSVKKFRVKNSIDNNPFLTNLNFFVLFIGILSFNFKISDYNMYTIICTICTICTPSYVLYVLYVHHLKGRTCHYSIYIFPVKFLHYSESF